MSGSTAERARVAGLVAADVATYVLVVTTVATVTALVVGVATGGGFVRAKVLLFLGGFGLMAFATVGLWPSSPEDLESDSEMVGETGRSIPGPATETRFQRAVRRLPPLRWLRPPPPERRVSPAGKLFLSSLAVLWVSFLMETAFGVS